MTSITFDKSGFDSTGDPVSSAGMLAFAGDVETQLGNMLSGVTVAFDKQLFTAAATLQISTSSGLGTITAPTQEIHYISAESGLYDTLDYIGVSNNRRVVLKATSGHTITISSGVGNINTIDNNAIVLSGNVMVEAWCIGSQWAVIGAGGLKNNTTALVAPNAANDETGGYDYGSMWVDSLKKRVYFNTSPSVNGAVWKRATAYQNGFRIKAAAATLAAIGIATPTISNTPAVSNDSNGTFVTLPTTASSGNLGGFVTASLNVARLEHDPTLEVLIEMDATITTMRLWIGFSTLDLTNVDDPAGATKFVGWRYSTNASDTQFTPVCDDGTTMSLGTPMDTVVASTLYKLKIQIDSGNARAYFTVNDGVPQAFGTNFPAAATDVGIVVRPITTSANIRKILFSYAEVGWG